MPPAESTTETTETAKPTRASVIAEAVAAATVEDDKLAPTVAEVKTKVEDKKPAAAAVEDTEAEDALLAQQGKDLMLALKDPVKAPIVIKFLAEQAGYSKSEVKEGPQSKTEVKELKNDILDDLREGLGEEFSIIADRLAPAIEKILNKQLEKSQADIRANLQEQEAEKLRGQSAAVIEKLTESFFGSDKELPDEVSKEMSNFMDRVAPAPNSTIKEYVEDSFHYAVGKLGLTKANKTSAEKVQRNRSDASSRLASERVPSTSSLSKVNAKTMTRQEAIQAAIEAVNKGE